MGTARHLVHDCCSILLTDWCAHTPRSLLAKNFGVADSAFAEVPTHELYIFEAQVPGPLQQDVVPDPQGKLPHRISHRLLQQEPMECPGGRVCMVDSSNFPAGSTIAAALVEVEPGGMRELHWRPNVDEWQYYIAGQGRMTGFASSGIVRTFDYRAGDAGYVPFAMGQYIQNTGESTLTILEMFRSDHFADLSLNQWVALTPPELAQAHLHLDQQTMAALRKDKPIIVK